VLDDDGFPLPPAGVTTEGKEGEGEGEDREAGREAEKEGERAAEVQAHTAVGAAAQTCENCSEAGHTIATCPMLVGGNSTGSVSFFVIFFQFVGSAAGSCACCSASVMCVAFRRYLIYNIQYIIFRNIYNIQYTL